MKVRIKETGQIEEVTEVKYKHRLMCGDSTTEDVNKLCGDTKSRLVFTDPPYGVSYSGTNNPNGREWTIIEGDNLRGDDLFKLICNASKKMFEVTIENPAVYMFYASKNHIIFEKALNEAGFVVKQQLIWDKHHILGHSDYHWCHEPILYCIKKDKNSKWFGDRCEKTIIAKNKTELRNLTKEELLNTLIKIKENSDMWELKKDSSNEYIHPTQKPYTLGLRAIINSSQEGESVIDLFSGSGSTLIACELTNRKCFAMEMDIKYVSAILERYNNLTKKGIIKL